MNKYVGTGLALGGAGLFGFICYKAGQIVEQERTRYIIEDDEEKDCLDEVNMYADDIPYEQHDDAVPEEAPKKENIVEKIKSRFISSKIRGMSEVLKHPEKHKILVEPTDDGVIITAKKTQREKNKS